MEIILPYKFNPRPYQLNLLKALDNGYKRALIVWNRRSGKDKTCFNYMIRKSFEKVGTYFYFLPSYKQSKKVIWDNIDNDGFRMIDHIPKELIKGMNATELKIDLINGSVIQLVAADEFSASGVGTNPVGVVFSEYSITDPNAWKFVSPILAANGGWAIFNFTPRGMNHAFHLLNSARDNEKWFTEVLTVDDTHVFTEEALEEEKRNNPQDFFEQEYYCKFIDGAGQFFRNFDKCLYDGDVTSGRFQLGVDLAKYQDYTVITPFDLISFKAGRQDRFNQMDWTTQKAKIENAYLNHGRCLVRLDSTGLGDPILDDLLNKGVNVEGYKFTEQSRTSLLRNLQMLLEQGKIKIPRDETLINELKSFQYVVGDSGKTKIQVPEGAHDDCVMSLALAVWDVPNNPMVVQSPLQRLLSTPEVKTQRYSNYD